MLSFLRVPKGVSRRFDFFRARMLWQEKQGMKKYHLVRWPGICQPREQEGLGVSDLQLKNVSMLCRWIWRLKNEEGDWQNLVRAKYLKRGTFTQCKPNAAHSHFWAGIIEAKKWSYSCCQRIVGDGRKTRFREGSWIWHRPIC